MNHPTQAREMNEIKAVAIATVDELRERIKSHSKLKGRQADAISIDEVCALFGPKPAVGLRPTKPKAPRKQELSHCRRG